MNLVPAIKLAMKVATGKLKLPCLNHIAVGPGFVEATDLDVWIRVRTDYAGPAALLPVGALKDTLRKAKTLAVAASAAPGKFVLDNGTVKVEVTGYDPNDYPLWPVALDALQPVTTIRQDRLSRAHARLVDHLGDELRITLQYYSLELHPETQTEGTAVPGMARLVATNGQTLSTANLRSTGSSEGTPSTHFVHPRAVELLLQSRGERVTLSQLPEGEGNVRLLIENEECSVLTKTDVGLNSFPRWRQLGGPKGPLLEVAVLASALQPVLEAAPRGPVAIHLAADGATCLVGWADEASENKITARASLAQRDRGCGLHPRLDFALHAGYLKALVARAPGALSLGLGSNCVTPESVSGYRESIVVCVDSAQELTEVTWIMPMRTKDGALPEVADQEQIVSYLVERGRTLGLYPPVPTAEAA